MKHQPSLITPIVCLANRLESIADKYVFIPMGLSAISVKILSHLKKSASLTPSELIKLTGSTKSNLSQRLGFLEREGLIRRDSAYLQTDKRKVKIHLTAAGADRLKEIAHRLKKAKLCLEKTFSPEEIDQHLKFLTKLNDRLNIEEIELEKLFKK
jgi:DNA-binding MarR family transcriptional regulator